MTAAPATRHQRVVVKLVMRLGGYCEARGGEVLIAPYDVYFSQTNVVEPDVLYVREEHRDRIEKRFLRSAPDLVVEVSSPSTRRLELVRKRELYERFGVPEYWFIDLDADRVEIYRLEGGRYGRPLPSVRGDTIQTPQAQGFTLEVEDLLGPPED